ncbi:hypothetical protein EON65_26785, partial [archaeon]
MITRTITMLLILLISTIVLSISTDSGHLHCRDPDIGAHHYKHSSKRSFLLIAGNGGGIGNFLVFFPSAYYFAMLTGRDILIQDGSLIGEMCNVIHCGFPHYSEFSAAFPNILKPSEMGSVRGIKAYDFGRHIYGQAIVEDKIVRADGYRIQSGWYLSHNYSEYCINKLTGCDREDVSCHDRHALQQLVRGPFLEKFQKETGGRQSVVGVPSNLRQGVLTLPHAIAPRLDGAVHLRCQFKHFEFLVGPEDSLWQNYVNEVNEWLDSTASNAGLALFKTIEQKILEEMDTIIQRREDAQRRRYLSITRQLSKLEDELPHINLTAVERGVAQSTYTSDSNHVYIYLASDNERVKEAFAQYLVGHANISVMRVLEPGHTVHAKNIDYLKQSAGIFPLVMDWYAMSLANIVFAWRRDTNVLSTFAHSAQRVSGNLAVVEGPDGARESGGQE